MSYDQNNLCHGRGCGFELFLQMSRSKKQPETAVPYSSTYHPARLCLAIFTPNLLGSSSFCPINDSSEK